MFTTLFTKEKKSNQKKQRILKLHTYKNIIIRINTMKIKKYSIFYSLIILLLCIFFIILYTNLVFENDIITDARNYFSFYKEIEHSGFFYFISKSYAASGKLEFVFYFIYSILSYFPTFNNFFNFIFVNYIIIALLTLKSFMVCSKTFSTTSYFRTISLSLVLVFSWFPSYLNMLWLWRADFAYALLLLSYLYYINNKYFLFLIFAFLSIFSHYSSLPILTILILLFIFSKNFNKISLGLKIFISLILSFIGAFFYKAIKRSFTSGEGNWVSDYYLGNAMLAYFFLGLIIITVLVFLCRREIPKHLFHFITTFIFFSLFCFMIALSSNGNHQDITRTMHVPFLLLCMTIPLIKSYGSIIQKYFINAYILMGCIGTAYIIINFFLH